MPLANEVEGTQSPREFVEAYAAKGNCCIGTPDDAIAYIQDLLDRSGGFGTFLMLGHDWASPEATYHSYELFARKVIPHFKGQLDGAAGVARVGEGQAQRTARSRRRSHLQGDRRAHRRDETSESEAGGLGRSDSGIGGA